MGWTTILSRKLKIMVHIGAVIGSHTVESLMTCGWIKSLHALCCKCNRSDGFTDKTSQS